jgi:hypothetical protein
LEIKTKREKREKRVSRTVEGHTWATNKKIQTNRGGAYLSKGLQPELLINPSSQRDREEREKGERQDTRSYDPGHLPQMAA